MDSRSHSIIIYTMSMAESWFIGRQSNDFDSMVLLWESSSPLHQFFILAQLNSIHRCRVPNDRYFVGRYLSEGKIPQKCNIRCRSNMKQRGAPEADREREGERQTVSEGKNEFTVSTVVSYVRRYGFFLWTQKTVICELSTWHMLVHVSLHPDNSR